LQAATHNAISRARGRAARKSTILHIDFEAETQGILRDALTVIDDHPNDDGYIVLGLGDMGDRMLGTK
jgi:hypothetical protein